MGGTVNGVRFVRCPKCLKVLTEFPDVPVYKCGGCSTVLQAKNHVISQENMASSSHGNSSQNSSGNCSLNNESASLVNQPIDCPLELNNGVEEATSSTLTVSDSNVATCCNVMVESSEHGEKGLKLMEEKDYDGPRPTDQLGFGRSDRNCSVEGKTEESIQVKEEQCLSEGTGHSPLQRPQDCDGMRSSNEVEESSESPLERSQGCDGIISSNEVEESSESIGNDDASFLGHTRSPTRSSNAYDGSASSNDENRRDHVPKKYLLLSKRTFRCKKTLNSVDSMKIEAEESNFEANEMTTDVGLQPEPQNFEEKSSNEKNQQASKYRIERDITFGSGNFHAVQIHGDSHDVKNGKPTTKLNYLEDDNMKILRKVDELRDELSGFIAKTEGKGTAPFKPLPSQIPLSERPHSKLPPSLPKVQTHVNAPRKLHYKEKMQPNKQYCRPVKGGAPFVICYRCWKLLHLPADFLAAQRRLHKLQCGACSEVLVFSFRPRVAMAQTPSEVRHPPSEVDSTNDCTESDPISYSGEYGLSFVKSYSAEAEPVLNVSRNSSYQTEKQDGESVKGSRLHRLMGYNSATDMLFRPGSSSVDEGYQSTEPRTPHFLSPSKEDEFFRYEADTPNSMEMQEEYESPERLRTRRKGLGRRGLALPGLLKKGVRELSHGLESIKLKVHANG